MMNEEIKGFNIPKTKKWCKYSWMRVDENEFMDTFDTIEECIKDAHYCWEHHVGNYENVDENNYDEINGFTINRPIIVIGIVNPMMDSIDFNPMVKDIKRGLTETLNETVYDETNGEFEGEVQITLCTSVNDFEDRLRGFIKDNFEIYPNKILTPFSLSYDLLSDKWIKY